jgi:hypothetical protein
MRGLLFIQVATDLADHPNLRLGPEDVAHIVDHLLAETKARVPAAATRARDAASDAKVAASK